MSTALASPPAPAPAPSPAPAPAKTGSPQPEPSSVFKIPSLEEMTRGKSSSEPLADPLAGILPKDGKAVAMPELGKDEHGNPLIENEDDGPIDTQIAPPKKDKKQIIEERRRKRDERLGIPDLEKQVETSRTEQARLQSELDTERAERAKEKAERDTFKTLAEQREGDLKEFNEKYFDTFKPVLDPAHDKELQTAHQTLFGTLNAEMPDFITAEGGAKQRVLFTQLASNPQVAAYFENTVAQYAAAQAKGDSKIMDLVVNSALSMLGADVKIKGIDSDQNVLMDSGDPEFVKVESALKKAIPQLAAKAERLNFLKNSAPELIEKQFKGREDGIRGRLNSEILLSPEDVQSRLSRNATDPLAIFSFVLNNSPALKQQVEASIAQMAPILASVPERLDLPPLMKNDAASVAAHRQMVTGRQKSLSEMATFAVIGKNAGPILASLIAERDAANKRANEHSRNTNPGPHEPGEHGPKSVPVIPTNIIPDR